MVFGECPEQRLGMLMGVIWQGGGLLTPPVAVDTGTPGRGAPNPGAPHPSQPHPLNL